MSNVTLNFTTAQTVNVFFDKKASIPLTGIFNDLTNPLAPVPIDLTTYDFQFYLKIDGKSLTTYEIGSGVLSTPYLVKNGTSHSTLDMSAMWENIKSFWTGSNMTLSMVMITPAGKQFIAIIYKICVTDN